jgi:hypothetical protein
MYPGEPRRVPFGPEVSWPAGYSDLEFREGDYRYAASQPAEVPAANTGAHPYGAFAASGYGDDGYSDPGYQGPSAQDAGIAGTRTVRGFVESGQGESAYPGGSGAHAGYAQPGYQNQPYAQGGYPDSRYAGSSYAGGQIEMAYPATATSSPQAYPGGAQDYRGGAQDYPGGAQDYRGGGSRQQPWDYDQPLRYDGEEESYYPGTGAYGAAGSGAYPAQGSGAYGYQQQYDPAAYNGSDYSMPGINGPGYDLSGIIATSDFEAVDYDEPSYGRLSYDDPRYSEGQNYPEGQRYGGTPGYSGGTPFAAAPFSAPAFDETRLDNLWLSGEDARREAEAVGYGNDGFADGPVRSSYASDFDLGQRGAFDATRFDMSAVTELGIDHTRFDVPAFDETRLDNLRVTGPGLGLRATGTTMLAPSPGLPRSWAEDTSLDHFADLDLTDEPVPAAFTRTLERPQPEEDAAARRTGRRRGRSGDRRQWMALGAIAIVAAGAIGGVLMKFKFSGPSGPAHTVSAVPAADGYARSANLEKQMNVAGLASSFTKSSGGQVSDVTSAVYQKGGVNNPQIFMFVGGKLASSDPNASVQNFEAHYPHAVSVPAGVGGGEAACTVTELRGDSVSMCVWFDNDTFGAFVSPTMTTDKLATTMDAVRPNLETVANSAV